MRNESPAASIWRRKYIVAVTCLIAIAASVLVSRTEDKVYESGSTLLISLPQNEQTFDTVQASQAVARSYADIIGGTQIARRVAARLRSDDAAIRDATSFESLPETQLLKIRAQDNDPRRAALIANTYASVFTQYASDNLQPTTKANISLAESASVPDSAVRPRPLLYAVIAAILGFALGVTLALLRDRLDRRLRTLEEVEAKFDVPVLARVPRRGRSPAAVVAFEEAYRILRTNLQFVRPDGRPRTIAVTSARDGEGKTTTVAQLARAIAETGIEVVAVEADFRRPALARELVPDRAKRSGAGLSNYLAGGVKLDEVLGEADRPLIKIVRSGPLPPAPSALLESSRAQSAISALADDADMVLFDCPPLNVAADASVIGTWADGVILVVDLENSTDRGVQVALRQLEAVHATLLGVVVNRDPDVGAGGYSYYLEGAPSVSRGEPQTATLDKIRSAAPLSKARRDT